MYTHCSFTFRYDFFSKICLPTRHGLLPHEARLRLEADAALADLDAYDHEDDDDDDDDEDDEGAEIVGRDIPFNPPGATSGEPVSTPVGGSEPLASPGPVPPKEPSPAPKSCW